MPLHRCTSELYELRFHVSRHSYDKHGVTLVITFLKESILAPKTIESSINVQAMNQYK